MPPTQTATVVVTDLVGSTELAGRLGHDRYELIRRAHVATLQAVVVEHGGVEVKGTGDGVLVRFDSAADAVHAAAEMQQRTAAPMPSAPATPTGSETVDGPALTMRVGIAIGEISLDAGDIHGRAVVEAARLCDAAGPGEILCTEPVRWIAAAVGADGFEALEPLTLKGFDAPVAAAKVRWEPDDAPGAEPTDHLIEIDSPGSAVTRVMVTGPVDLGREAEIVIDDTTVSRRHVRLSPVRSGLLVTDLGSTNGTFVDGERLAAPAVFGPGSSARIGATTLRVLEPPRSRPPHQGGSSTVHAPNDHAVVSPDAGAGSSVLARTGRIWSATFGGRTVGVPDTKGLRYLAVLLASPGQAIHVLDLVAVVEGTTAEPVAADRGSGGPILDETAKRDYQRRISHLDAELAAADRAGDPQRSRRATEERDFLLRELSGAVGLGGRDRRPSDDAERARSAVGRAIRNAVGRLADVHPPLHDHLAATLHTGMRCSYAPDTRTPCSWTIIEG